MKRIAALVALVSVGCGGESFSGLEEATPVDSGTVDSCTHRFLALPGDDGALAELECPNFVPPFTVGGRFRLETGELRLEREPCWSLTIRGTVVKATVPALFDHFAEEPIAGTGWRQVVWHYDGIASTVLVDDSPISVADRPRGAWPFAACAGPTTIEGSGDVDWVTIQGADYPTVGLSRVGRAELSCE
jgi:hypothetical protein